MASFTVSWSTTDTTATITARFTGGDSSFVGTRYVYFEIGTSIGDYIEVPTRGGSTTFTRTIRGLSPGTTYSYYTCLGYKTSSGSTITWLENQYSRRGSFSTDRAQVSATYWSWTRSNGSASAYQTSSAYTAITSKGYTSSFSYLVWNDLVNKVNELIGLSGGTWDSYYLSLSSTRMSSYDLEMTARRFNSLRNNINFYVNTGLPVVNQGDVIYGSYFITFANAINNWIGRL